MAEFCLECWNKMHHKKCGKWDVKLSWGIDFCEGCGKWKRVVLEEREYRDNRFVLVWVMIFVVDGIVQLFLQPVRCYQAKRKRRSK